MPKAVVLMSGGLDSTTCLAVAIEQGFEPIALSFDYGQRHRVELECAREIVESYRVQHHLIADLDIFKQIGRSALTANIPVPKPGDVCGLGDEIPVTYVPARNLVFLSIATGVAEVHCASNIFIGVNALDYSGYPDCRPAFISAFQETSRLATQAGVEGTHIKINTPLIDLTKAEIIKLGLSLGAPYQLTHSCYAPTPDGLACGMCDSCVLRLKGFEDAGEADPIRYASQA